MKVIDPGHVYELRFLDGTATEHDGSFGCGLSNDRLTFVKREGDKYPGNVGHHPGTTMQEVLRAVIDRLTYLNEQVYDASNFHTMALLREAIYTLEKRAARRHGRELRLDPFERQMIEDLDVCPKCLHIGCEGGCHADTQRSQADGHTD